MKMIVNNGTIGTVAESFGTQDFVWGQPWLTPIAYILQAQYIAMLRENSPMDSDFMMHLPKDKKEIIDLSSDLRI